MVADPPDLDLSEGGLIKTIQGTIVDAHQQPIQIPNFLLSAPVGGAAIRVFVANDVKLGNVSIFSGEASTGPAVAIVAVGAIKLDGNVSLWLDSGRDGAYNFAGGVNDATCRGGVAQYDGGYPGADYIEQSAGGGGGGHATKGGHGGGIAFQLAGGAGGLPSGSAALVPLRGGCAGGGISAGSGQPGDPGPSGGGAIQLVSNLAIELETNAIINASGSMGQVQESGPMPDLGGGAGGGILLEAPAVTLGHGVRLLVNGGPGGSGDDQVGVLSLSGDVSPGGRCLTMSTDFKCTNGGDGAGLAGAANDIADLAPRSGSNPNLRQRGGAGGGGLGFIRINSATGEYTASSDVILSGLTSAGTIRTR
jgi:hypothetical protein